MQLPWRQSSLSCGSLFAALALLSAPVWALEYPDPSHPAAKTLVAQYQQDKALVDSPALFAVPNPAPAWPCEVPEVDQYRLGGLSNVHPSLKADIDKQMRKAFREAGMSPDMMPKTTYSNIQIIPLKAQCAGGKLDGDLQLLVVYDKLDESFTSTQMGEETVKGATRANLHYVGRFHKTVKAGLEQPGLRSFLEMTMQNETHYDNARMEATHQKSVKQLNLNKPTVTRSVIYTGADGTVATFMTMDEKQVSGGLFGVKVKEVQSLTTMLMLPVDERRKRSETYKNKQLVGASWLKDGKPHGEQVMYMDNYLKKLKLRLDQQPGMENAREVTINGVDLIEQRTCYQNGVAIKTATCSNE